MTSLDETKPKIINISTYALTKDGHNQLIIGLKFSPFPKSNITNLKEDLREFGRKLRLM